jgi:hypothetical protein
MTSTRDDQRQRWRGYNKSPQGRERFRRYRQSPHGKARLREKYLERVRFLDEIKSKAGCRICRETSPEVLSFIPKRGQKVKFLPVLSNISRSLHDWEKVVASSFILCGNCLRKKTSWKSGGSREYPKFRVRVRQVKRSGSTKERGQGYQPSPEEAKTKAPQKCAAHFVPATEACKCCGREYFRRRSWQRTCSRECQLILLAAETFLRAYREGRASGLYNTISELGGKPGS